MTDAETTFSWASGPTTSNNPLLTVAGTDIWAAPEWNDFFNQNDCTE